MLCILCIHFYDLFSCISSLFSIILVPLLILWQCYEHVLFLSLFIVANILLFFVCSVAWCWILNQLTPPWLLVLTLLLHHWAPLWPCMICSVENLAVCFYRCDHRGHGSCIRICTSRHPVGVTTGHHPQLVHISYQCFFPLEPSLRTLWHHWLCLRMKRSWFFLVLTWFIQVYSSYYRYLLVFYLVISHHRKFTS